VIMYLVRFLIDVIIRGQKPAPTGNDSYKQKPAPTVSSLWESLSRLDYREIHYFVVSLFLIKHIIVKAQGRRE
jgi:hypothetical protein